MDKYQTRSISSNFFSAADTIDDKIDDSQADTAQVDFDTVNRGDTTSSVSLTQNPSEPILTNTEDLEFKTTSEAIDNRDLLRASNVASLDQQTKPLNINTNAQSFELEVQNMSVVDGDVEIASVNDLQTFTRVALKAEVSSGTYGLKDTTLSGTEDLPNVALNLIDASSNSTAITISSGSSRYH